MNWRAGDLTYEWVFALQDDYVLANARLITAHWDPDYSDDPPVARTALAQTLWGLETT